MERVFILITPMQVAVVAVAKVSQFSTIYLKKYEIVSPDSEYSVRGRGYFFCSFDLCGQYVKRSGHNILVALQGI